MSKCLRFVSVLFVIIAPLHLKAQTLGIEFGGELDRLIGKINNPCGCPFDSGSGTGFNSTISAERSLGLGFSAGIKTRYSHKNISSSIPRDETVIILSADGNADSTTILTTNKLDASISYIGVTPFVEYKIPKIGIFLQTGVGAMFPVSSSIKQIRQLNQTSVVLNGQVVRDLKFQNGSTTEPIEAEDPMSNLNSPQYYASMWLGGEIKVVEDVLYGAVTYDLPLTDVRTSDSWKIASLGAVIGMKFDIK